jgi:hypothetical protein
MLLLLRVGEPVLNIVVITIENRFYAIFDLTLKYTKRAGCYERRFYTNF